MLQHFQENSFSSTVKENIPELSTVHFQFEYFKDPSKENNDAKNNRVLLFPKTSYFWEHLSHA